MVYEQGNGFFHTVAQVCMGFLGPKGLGNLCISPKPSLRAQQSNLFLPVNQSLMDRRVPPRRKRLAAKGSSSRSRTNADLPQDSARRSPEFKPTVT